MTFPMNNAVRLQLEDFSIDTEVAALRERSKRIGGIVTFLGTARDFSEGREVSEIAFDAYQRMALAELVRVREEAMTRFDLIEARIVHRLGTVLAGENIVLIVVGAQHRAAAFEACRWLIDELKARAPIWKKEITPQGESWVTPHP
jgi:molybdopterin synthase catalytic subunit